MGILPHVAHRHDGNLIGSWIGREGQGAQAWTTYWLNPNSKIELNFRHQKVSPEFIPDGGTLTDFGVSTDYWLRSNLGSFRLGATRALAFSCDSAECLEKRNGSYANYD